MSEDTENKKKDLTVGGVSGSKKMRLGRVHKKKTDEGEVMFDPTGKLSGRGAYLCPREECITAELKKAAKLSKGLKKPLTDEEIKALAKSLLERIEEN